MKFSGSLVRVLSLLSLLAAIPAVAQAQTEAQLPYDLDFSRYDAKPPWNPSEETLARMSERRPNSNFRESGIQPYTLPDMFTCLDGEKVTRVAQWEGKRRGELLELFRDEVYGVAPPKPEDLTFGTIETDPAAMDGKATLKRIRISFTVGGAPFHYPITLFVPNDKTGAVPVILLLSHRGVENTDPTRQQRTEFWPAEYAIQRGYAIAAVNVAADVEPDDKNNTTKGLRAYYRDHHPDGAKFTWGALGAWAWSGSRAVDYFETDPDIDPKRIGVIGHSRGGKTSLWAGAQDERFALVCVNASGCGGTAPSRRNFGEEVHQLNGNFPHWMCEQFKTYNHRIEALPVDQHEALALVAPRAVHQAVFSEDFHADPRGSWLSLVEASKAWVLYEVAEAMEEAMPPMNTLYENGPIGYHMRDGGHDLTLYDWKNYLDHADRVFRPSLSRSD